MIAENPLALAYILPGDVFFLQSDKQALTAVTSPEAVETSAEISAPPAMVNEPVAVTAIPQIVTPPKAAQPVATVIQTPAAPFNYTGGYQKNFLVFVHYPQHQVMEPAHQAALESTIKRKDLSLIDIAIFNLAQYPGADLKAIGGFFKPQKMLFLGADAVPPGWKTPAFNQLTKLSKCDVLCTYSFGDMMGNKDNTKAFGNK
jgi:hypothetical protein